MKPAKNLTVKSASSASGRTRKNKAEYPGPDNDSATLMAKDVAGEYHKSLLPDVQAFRSSMPYQLMGCAQGFMSNMTDDEIKDMMIRDRYDL